MSAKEGKRTSGTQALKDSVLFNYFNSLKSEPRSFHSLVQKLSCQSFQSDGLPWSHLKQSHFLPCHNVFNHVPEASSLAPETLRNSVIVSTEGFCSPRWVGGVRIEHLYLMKCYILRSESYSVKPWKPHYCDVTSLASAPAFSEASLVGWTTLASLPTSSYFRWFSMAADLTSDFPKTWNSSGYIRITSQSQAETSTQNHCAPNVCLALVQMGSTACGLTMLRQGKRKEAAAGEMITFQTPVCACFPFSPPFPTLVWWQGPHQPASDCCSLS